VSRASRRNWGENQEAANKPELYVDGHDVELWEGTHQVALLTRSNLPLNSSAFCGCERAAVRPSASERSTVGKVMFMCQVPAGTLCVNGSSALAPEGLPVLR
jgi:hypothetical protein